MDHRSTRLQQHVSKSSRKASRAGGSEGERIVKHETAEVKEIKQEAAQEGVVQAVAQQAAERGRML